MAKDQENLNSSKAGFFKSNEKPTAFGLNFQEASRQAKEEVPGPTLSRTPNADLEVDWDY